MQLNSYIFCIILDFYIGLEFISNNVDLEIKIEIKIEINIFK